MRIAVVSPFPPAPGAGHGGARYVGTLVEALGRHARVDLYALAAANEVRPDALADLPGAQRTVVVQRARGDVTGLRQAALRGRNLGRWLRGEPLVAAKARSPGLETVLRRAVAAGRVDIALVEFAVCAQVLPALRGVPAVLTDHEAAEALPADLLPLGLGRARDRRLWRRYISRFYPLADAVQALSASDAAAIAARIGRPVGVRPAVVPLPDAAAEPGAAPPRALFTGDFRHRPNRAAAEFAAREVWPRVRARVPGAELWLCGAHAPAEVEALGALDGVVWRGFEPDLGTALRSVRAALCPVFSGHGVRIKVLDALAHGVGVVANELGARGVDAPAPALHRAEGADAFADALCALLAEPGAAAAAGEHARRWALATIAPDAVAAAQLAVCRELIARRR